MGMLIFQACVNGTRLRGEKSVMTRLSCRKVVKLSLPNTFVGC